MTVTTQLVVSLSGLEHRTLDRCAELAGDLDRRAVPLSLLIEPRLEHLEPRAAQLLEWVTGRLTGQDTVSLHGFAELRARVGQGVRLPAHESGLRLAATVAVFERFGLYTESFVPPRWVASPGTVTALQRRGFTVCADALAIRELSTGRVHRSRIRLLGPGDRMEPWWCRSLVTGAGRAVRNGKPVRLAIEAAALAKPTARQAVLDAIDLALEHGAKPVTHGDFVLRQLLIPHQRQGGTGASSQVSSEEFTRG